MQPIYIVIEIFCFFFMLSLQNSVRTLHLQPASFQMHYVCAGHPLPISSCNSQFFPAHSQLTVTFIFQGSFSPMCSLLLRLYTCCLSHPSPPRHPVLSHLSLNFQGSPSMNFTSESSMMVSLSTCPSVGTHFNLSL